MGARNDTNKVPDDCSSQTKGLLVNADGSVDVYFGPKAPAGKEKNWVQTVPGEGWNTILRLYGPLEPWFAKTWRPGEIEPLYANARHVFGPAANV